MTDKLEACTCPECGHVNESASIDLWTLCTECYSHLITDAQIIAWDEAEERGIKAA